MSDTVTVRAVLHGEEEITVDRGEYEQAKVDGTLDQYLDAHLSDIEQNTEIHEPDGTVINPHG